VDHERLADLLGDIDVRAEPVALQLRRGIVPVVVEPGLTDRSDLREGRQPRDLGLRGLPPGRRRGCGRRLVRVNRDRR
jgi:hypothetical protein